MTYHHLPGLGGITPSSPFYFPTTPEANPTFEMAKIPYLKYRRPSARQAQTDAGQRFLLKRTVLQWFVSQHKAPDALATDVPTSMNADRADVAAVWDGTVKTSSGRKLLVPQKSCVVVCALSRRECYAASINPDALVNELTALRKRLTILEENIRRDEPELRDTHTLFEEYADWDYEHSQNQEYHDCKKRTTEIEEKLYRGTRMERIQHNRAANQLYLAIPEGTVFPDEVMPDWGVLTVSPDYKITVERVAPDHETIPEVQLHLAQQIAISATDYLLAGQGIRGRRKK